MTQLCATVTADSMEELRRKRDQQAGADLVELRLDTPGDVEVKAALQGRETAVLVTCRPKWEGGEFDGTEEERRNILLQAVDEGADMLIGETYYYAEEAFKALEVMKKTKLPTVVTIAPMAEDIMRDGYGIVETCKELEQRGADVVGMNCFRGPPTMLPYLKEIRKQVKCHVAALPIPVRTNKKYTTWFNLPDRSDCGCGAPHGRTFPTALEPLMCNRYEIGQFAKDAYKMGINYLGVCCLGNPMLVREVAHAVGLTVPASKYREKMENHFMYGENIPKHMKEYGNKA